MLILPKFWNLFLQIYLLVVNTASYYWNCYNCGSVSKSYYFFKINMLNLFCFFSFYVKIISVLLSQQAHWETNLKMNKLKKLFYNLWKKF